MLAVTIAYLLLGSTCRAGPALYHLPSHRASFARSDYHVRLAYGLSERCGLPLTDTDTRLLVEYSSGSTARNSSRAGTSAGSDPSVSMRLWTGFRHAGTWSNRSARAKQRDLRTTRCPVAACRIADTNVSLSGRCCSAGN